MATPQSFFGGTSRKKQSDPTLNQVGDKSAVSPDSYSNTSKQTRPVNANLSTSKLVRPNVPGKVDNRNQNIGNSI